MLYIVEAVIFNYLIFRSIEEAKRLSAPERKNLKSDVRRGLDSLISASMARNIRDTGTGDHCQHWNYNLKINFNQACPALC